MVNTDVDLSKDEIFELYHRISNDKQELNKIITVKDSNDEIIARDNLDIQLLEKLEWKPTEVGDYQISINGNKHNISVIGVKIIDDFERDNLDHYVGSLSEFEITDSISRVGNKCLRGFVSDDYDGWESIYSIDGLDYYPEPGQIFELYVYNDASQYSAVSSFRFGVSDLNTDETTQISARRRINRSSGSRARIRKNGDIIEEHEYSGSLDNKTWYRVVVKWPVEEPIEIDWYNDETGANNLHMELIEHQDINGGGIGFGRTYSGDEHFYDGFKIIDTI